MNNQLDPKTKWLDCPKCTAKAFINKSDLNMPGHVMGWKRVEMPYKRTQLAEILYWNDGSEGRVMVGKPYPLGNGIYNHSWDKFQPTTSWADCGMVLDNIHPGEKFMNFELVKVANPPDAAWIATIDTVCATGPTKQIAICKLALAMKGVEA